MNETITDIVAELRNNASDFDCADPRRKMFSHYADRIEAAWKREMSKNASKNGADFGQFGNEAAMRKALKSVAAWLLERFGNPADPDHDKAEGFYILATGVLAMPPRNCDVGTAKEQSKRFGEFCFAHRTMEYCCDKCPAKDDPSCELAWAQMPYEEGDAK